MSFYVVTSDAPDSAENASVTLLRTEIYAVYGAASGCLQSKTSDWTRDWGLPIIALGDTQWLNPEWLTGVGTAGYTIRRIAGTNITVIAGPSSQGTYLGVLQFIEDLGVKQYFDGALWKSPANGAVVKVAKGYSKTISTPSQPTST